MKLALIPVLIWQYLVPYQLWINKSNDQITNLEACIAIALEQNSALQLEQIERKRSDIDHRQAHLNRLPGVSAYVSHGFSKGRSVDPTTNLFTEQSFGYGSQQISTDMTLFNGLQTLHQIRAKAQYAQAAHFGYEAAVINLKLDVLEAYLGVQTAEQMMAQTQNQVFVMQEQMRRTTLLFEEGAAAPQDFYELSGQWQKEEQLLEQAKKQVSTARLRLARILEIPVEKLGPLEKLDLPVRHASHEAILENEEQILRLPQMKNVDARIKAAQYEYRSAKGAYFPSISISAGLGGQYSNKIPTPYFEQFQNNLGRSVSASLRIPLFNRLQTYHQVKLAKFQIDASEWRRKQMLAQLKEETTNNQLELTMMAQGIARLEKQLAFYQESFRIAQAHFDEGNSHAYIYLSAKHKLDQTEKELLILVNSYILQAYLQDSYLGLLKL